MDVRTPDDGVAMSRAFVPARARRRWCSSPRRRSSWRTRRSSRRWASCRRSSTTTCRPRC
ncbi:MAG: hypothetical protein MZV64_73350 [Ignavibacteriales bacterium]|nr:hypothetical protein [Ignavibacteriales bacterium]